MTPVLQYDFLRQLYPARQRLVTTQQVACPRAHALIVRCNDIEQPLLVEVLDGRISVFGQYPRLRLQARVQRDNSVEREPLITTKLPELGYYLLLQRLDLLLQIAFLLLQLLLPVLLLTILVRQHRQRLMCLQLRLTQARRVW